MIVFSAFVQAAQDFWHFHLALNLSRYTRSNDNDCREITDLMFIPISVSFLLFFWRYVPNSWQSSGSKIDKSLTLNDRYISYLTNRKSFKVGLSPSKKFGFICVNESPLKISFFLWRHKLEHRQLQWTYCQISLNVKAIRQWNLGSQ